MIMQILLISIVRLSNAKFRLLFALCSMGSTISQKGLSGIVMNARRGDGEVQERTGPGTSCHGLVDVVLMLDSILDIFCNISDSVIL